MAKKKTATRKPAIKPAAKVEIPAVGLKAARSAAKAQADIVLKVKEKSVKTEKTVTQSQPEKLKKETTMTDAKQKFEKLTSDATTLGQENVEAIVQSSTLFFKGAEDILKTYTTLAQEAAQKNAEGLQSLLGCKTLNELTETQNKLAKDSFEGFIAQATKLSELSLKVAKESLEPINAQVNKTVKRATAA
jgi:phasin family protein